MADFGAILRKIGEFGLFQKTILLALCVPNLILPFHFMSVLFIQSDPERHCNTDWILKAAPNLTTDEKLNLTLPREDDGTFSKCLMYVPVEWDINAIRKYGLNDTTGCQNGWVYNSIMYRATIVTDFDLVCDQAGLVGVAQAVLMAGILFGCLLLGPFAESFGRKRASQIPVVIMLIFTVTTGLSPNFYLYLTSQFMVGIGYGGFRLNGIILGKTPLNLTSVVQVVTLLLTISLIYAATEWIGVSKRSWGACGSQVFGALGQAMLAGMIYLIRDWRLAQLVTAAPIAVMAVYIWFIPESARWLLEVGRTEEAEKLIAKVAKINKRSVPHILIEKAVTKEIVKRRGVVLLFESSVLRKYFLAITMAWFSLNVVYYSLSFNVGNFGLDIFLTQALFGFSELPAHLICIWLLEIVGRKLSLISTLLAGGLLSVLILAVPRDNAVPITVLAIGGRIFSNWAGAICNVYIQELFPTSFRQTASGLGSIASRIGGLVAPLLNMLVFYHWSIPTAVLSSLSLTSGVLCFLLPETAKKELPDSTDEAEANRSKTTLKKQSKTNKTPQTRSTEF